MRGKLGGFRVAKHLHRIIPARAGQTSRAPTPKTRTTDHPRACGANDDCEEDAACSCGSSPRVRGKRLAHVPESPFCRIIPARAGQTPGCRCPPVRRSDHPRACGANSNVCLSGRSPPGSSPRVRGKPGPLGLLPVAGRIIPARAGQTRCRSGNILYPPDHPRACGANPQEQRNSRPKVGSSPRVRGKPGFELDSEVAVRIIPARAGQTRPWRNGRGRTPDHPRACGANTWMSMSACAPFGSSPRVRGKLECVPFRQVAARIIPARAGQTRSTRSSSRRRSDHPRACGANPVQVWKYPLSAGSSPRVRGKLGEQTLPQRLVRIIPARAGQTRPVSLVGLPAPDHPRACGANMVWSSSFRSLAGSSPRVRGKQETQLRPRYWGRIIPARAGQTPSSSLGTVPVPDHPRACGANSKACSPERALCGSSPRVRGKPGRCRPIRARTRIIPARAGQTRTRPASPWQNQDHPRACGANAVAHG